MPKPQHVTGTMQLTGDNTTRRSEGGFTLIEVMMAMAIFSIGVLAVFAMQTTSMSRSSSAVKSNQAGFWAQDYVEYLMCLPYNDDDGLLDTVSSVAGGLIRQNTEGPYTITWAVFSSAENNKSINSYGNIVNNAMFANVDTAQNLQYLRTNTKVVMVNVTHPLGEEVRVVFIKPNI